MKQIPLYVIKTGDTYVNDHSVYNFTDATLAKKVLSQLKTENINENYYLQVESLTLEE